MQVISFVDDRFMIKKYEEIIQKGICENVNLRNENKELRADINQIIKRLKKNAWSSVGILNTEF